MNRLEEILAAKRDEIEQLRPRLAELDRQAQARNDFRDFRAALETGDEKLAIIAEVKKASPSAGVIAQSFDPEFVKLSFQQDYRQNSKIEVNANASANSSQLVITPEQAREMQERLQQLRAKIKK